MRYANFRMITLSICLGRQLLTLHTSQPKFLIVYTGHGTRGTNTYSLHPDGNPTTPPRYIQNTQSKENEPSINLTLEYFCKALIQRNNLLNNVLK